jgi:U4/U6.U5 tri-snRNP-associated protein 3
LPFGERSAASVLEKSKAAADSAAAAGIVQPVLLTDDMDDEARMRALGLPCGFDTTQGKEVKDGNVAGVRVASKRQFRQYMNRRGGFNRPLAPSY